MSIVFHVDSVSCRLRIFVRIIKECSTIFYQSQIIGSLTSSSQNDELSRDFTDHVNRAVLDFKDNLAICMKNVFSNINSNSLIGVETSSAVFPPTELIAMELDLVLKKLLWTKPNVAVQCTLYNLCPPLTLCF